MHSDISSVLLSPSVGEIRSLQEALLRELIGNIVYRTDLSCFPAFLLAE